MGDREGGTVRPDEAADETKNYGQAKKSEKYIMTERVEKSYAHPHPHSRH